MQFSAHVTWNLTVGVGNLSYSSGEFGNLKKQLASKVPRESSRHMGRTHRPRLARGVDLGECAGCVSPRNGLKAHLAGVGARRTASFGAF